MRALLTVLKPYLPLWVRHLLRVMYRAYMNLTCKFLNIREGAGLRDIDGVSIPPPTLRFRVHGLPYPEDFLNAGRNNSNSILNVLKTNGMSFDDFTKALDFGCGCGSTLRWLRHSQGTELFGTDIDRDAVTWCQANLPFATTAVNGAVPPLAYADNTFDLIWAISVFTHLDEDRQLQWLAELRRIVKAGGVVIVSVLGTHHWQHLTPVDRASLQEKGFLFKRDGLFKGIFPDWYQTAYHTEDYVARTFSNYFDVVKVMPAAITSHDAVVLRKR